MKINELLDEEATAGATSAGSIAGIASVPGAKRKIKKDKNGIPKAPLPQDTPRHPKNFPKTFKNASTTIPRACQNLIKMKYKYKKRSKDIPKHTKNEIRNKNK